MAERLSYLSRRIAWGVAVCLVAHAHAAAPAAAQEDDLDARCGVGSTPDPECLLAAGAVRLIQPRVGIALWGGSTVPGTASTLGMRLGSLPRFSTAGRITLVPMELPPLPDRGEETGSRVLAGSVSGQATVGLLSGWSPLPTVGGVLSLDAVGRASWLLLPRGQGFEDRSVFGLSAGLRLGLLRESFTLPGVSLTGAYGRSTRFAYGDPGGTDDGYIEGSVASWRGTAAATRRFGPVRITGGGSYDRYTSEVDLSYDGAPADGVTADAATDRWSVFGNASWTFLIFHAVVEAGWQDAPTPAGLPPEVTVDPTGWWLGGSFRLSL